MKTTVTAIIFALSFCFLDGNCDEIVNNSPDYYVGGWQVNHEFDKVTDKCMEVLKTKRILVYGMSYSLSIAGGLTALAKQSPKHALNVKIKTLITPEDFDKPVFLRCDGVDRYPYTLRVEKVDTSIRKTGFDKVLDSAFVVWHNMSTSKIEGFQGKPYESVKKIYEVYSSIFDNLSKDYPQIKMLYCMPGVLPVKDVPGKNPQHLGNIPGVYFNAMVSDNYLGEVPLYDSESFLNISTKDEQNLIPAERDETKAGVYGAYSGFDVPKRFEMIAMNEQFVAGDRLHGWNAEGSPRFGRAILLTLSKAYCPENFKPATYPQKTLKEYPATLLKMSFEGNITDDSGNNLKTGLFKGRGGKLTFLNESSDSFIPGQNGKAFSFRKLQDIYPVVFHNDILNGMEKLSISVNAKRLKQQGFGALFFKQDQYELRLFEDELLGFLKTTKEKIKIKGKVTRDDAWHNYKLIYDGREVAAYFDGKKVFGQSASGPVYSTANSLFVGKKSQFGYTFEGELDDLSIFSKAE